MEASTRAIELIGPVILVRAKTVHLPTVLTSMNPGQSILDGTRRSARVVIVANYVKFDPDLQYRLLKLDEPPEVKRAIIDGIIESVGITGVPNGRLASGCTVHTLDLEGYRFAYRELTPRELDRLGQNSGYLVYDMEPMTSVLIRQLTRGIQSAPRQESGPQVD